jgi:hypothetical protein
MFTPYNRPVKLMPFQTYDLEWYPHTYQVRLVGTHNGTEYKAFKDVENFLDDHVFCQPSDTVFFAHAGGSHDVQFILLDLISRNDTNLEISAVFSGSSAIIVRIKRGNSTWLFCDSFWLMRDRLANIAKSLGMEKGGTDYHCPGQCAHPPDEACVFYAPFFVLKDYNELDCLILWRALDRLQDELLDLGGELRYTIASCAMRLFRREFLSRPIKTSREINDIAREAYIASRVEVIRHRCNHPANWYDINSSFPYSMTRRQPADLLQIKRGLKDSDEIALVRATVSVPDTYLPPLPYRKKGRIYFPAGTWTAWFDAVDLRALEDMGGSIDKVEKTYTFHGFDDLARYVDRIYSIRRMTADPFKKIVCKYLMNALYGKTAEKPEKERVLIDPRSTHCTHLDKRGAPIHMVNGVSQCMRLIHPRIWLVTEDLNLPHEHVPIAMHVTALSRQLLGGFMQKALNMGGDLYYCDTDGFPTEATLPTSDRLGDLKAEDPIRESAVFLAPKFYRKDDKVRSKGFSRLTRKDFDQVEQNPRGGIEFSRMLRLRELFRSGDLVPREKGMIKRLLLDETQTKRRMIGNNSEPWNVEDIV